MKLKNKIPFLISFGLLLFLIPSCKKFVEINPPRTDLSRSAVFSSEATARAALIDIYYSMQNLGFASGGTTSLSYLGSISSDEQIDYTSGGLNLVTQPFYRNTLNSLNQAIVDNWRSLYSWIYKANSILEGIQSSDKISASLKKQLEGEAKFIRAYCHFYLVNLWGPVPLVMTTDYEKNTHVTRETETVIYQQIITDLKDAQSLLGEDYSASNNERTRPNKWVATAFLARVYLYLRQWPDAENQATSVISKAPLFSLQTDLKNVFIKNNSEAIWQFASGTTNFPKDRSTFYIMGSTPSFGALSNALVSAFPTGDRRKTDWIGNVISLTGETYYFATKYSSPVEQAEYSTSLRLAEQYLIRAEARAWQDKIVDGNEDVNIIRRRALLSDIQATDKNSLLASIANERRLELFTEWGHRWLDLKRTEQINNVLSPIKSEWKPDAALYPIPEEQILNSPISQNPGY